MKPKESTQKNQLLSNHALIIMTFVINHII